MLCAILAQWQIFYIHKNKRGTMAYYDTPDNTASDMVSKYGITKALARASANRCRAVDELRFEYWDTVLDVLKSMKPKKTFKNREDV